MFPKARYYGYGERAERGKGESPGARVSSPSQKDDLERRAELIRSRGVEEVLTDGGSGLNDGEAEPGEATKNGDQERGFRDCIFLS